MTRTSLSVLAALVASTVCTGATLPQPVPAAPAEIAGLVPPDTTLIAFKSSGTQPDASAMAVFESKPDKNGSRERVLVVVGKRAGQFVPDFMSSRIIACSMCGQFHDDPFDIDYVKVTPGRIHIEQMDGGEKPSATTIDLVRQASVWRVADASRQTFDGGRGRAKNEKIAVPASGLAKDLDAQWAYTISLNTLMVNNRNGKFMFLHRGRSPGQVWDSEKADCNEQDCTILVQQEDGCISLVRDSAGRSFGAGVPDHKDRKSSSARAISACTSAGGQQCEVVRTDCSRGA